MKKVGIITTFRQPNYGSVLQAYALQKVIDGLGYDSELIDYIYPNSYHFERGLNWGKKYKKTPIQKVKYIIRLFLECVSVLPFPKMKLLNDFISNEMKCSKVYESYDVLHQNPPVYDIYVSGSDQIWNPNTMLGDMSYMFDFAPLGSKIISYSSSFSCDYIPDKYKEDYKKYLHRFYAISVRETNGQELVYELIGKTNAQVVVDPTLLLDKEDWSSLAIKAKILRIPKKYILCYKLAYTYNPDDKIIEMLHFVQRKYNLPIVSLSRIENWNGGELISLFDGNFSIGIYEFLRLFKEASIVITSSFHGTAFSLNFGIPFLSLSDGKSNSDDRISSLLKKMGMASQLITTNSVLNKDITPFYNINKEQNSLAIARKSSIDFLTNALI